MQDSCDAPAETTARNVRAALWRTARSALLRAWRDAPQYEAAVSWAGARRAALRCACCAVLLFAALAGTRPRSHVDLYPSYVAAHLANEGRWEHIYHRSVWLFRASDDPEWNRRAEALIAPQQLMGTSFVYHPWYLQILRPLVTLAPYMTFQAKWIVFNRLCVVAVGFLSALLLGLTRWREQLLLTFVVAIASTTSDSVHVGQNGLAALSFALAATAAWRSRTPLWVGGALAACAWACKPWCASLVLLCFMLRGMRAGLWTALVLACVMIVLPELTLSPVLMRDYREVTLVMTGISVRAFNNVSLLSIFERLSTPDWTQHLSDWTPRVAATGLRALASSLTIACFVAGVCVWWRRRASARYVIASYLAFMLVPLGICWTHYFVFALPLACLCTFDVGSPRLLRGLGIALLALLSGLLEFLQLSTDPLWNALFQPSVYPSQHAAPMLLLVTTCLAALLLGPREQGESPARVRARHVPARATRAQP